MHDMRLARSSSKRDIKLKLDEQKESLRKLQLLQTYKEKVCAPDPPVLSCENSA